MQKVVLFGCGSTAEVLHYHLTQAGHQVVGFCLDQLYLKQTHFLGCPLVAFETVEQYFPPGEFALMIAIGYVQVNQLRAQRFNEAKAKGYQLLSYISPQATLWEGFEAGSHCKIGSQTLIQPFAQLGENVFIGSGCIIGHHSQIGNHVFMGSGVILGGGVQIGDYAFLGSGVTARNKVQVAPHSVIGAGAVILENTREKGVYLATTAQELPYSSAELSPG